MKSSKMERFLPNECYICKSRDNLKRCECNMISYCSEDHRLKHLEIHKYFCKVIKEILNEKKLSHVCEELKNKFGSPWTTKRNEIYEEILKKLGRPISLLEKAMWKHPRGCFICCETEEENLTNCPNCPVASFCKKHPQNKIHTRNCKVMDQYLKILNTAEEFNIDLKFLAPTFPCITEDVNQDIDELTYTYTITNLEERCLKSRLLKMDLINFMDVASKINNALQKIHDMIPEELTIHIDALFSEHAIIKNNYWEFLLHLNPRIKQLKIVNTAIENPDNVETSLCENCISEEKELIVEYSSKSYDDYMLHENYQKPNILFYVKVVDECNSEKLNKWSEFDCPVILRFDSKLNFCKTQHFLSYSTSKFQFIYEGQFKTPFGTLSSMENEDYFIILQSKEKKVVEKSCVAVTSEINKGKITTNSLEILSDVDSETLKYVESDAKDASKITPSESSESKDNSDNNENSKLETNNNQFASTSYIDSNKIIVIEKENINKNETEEEKNFNNEKTENRESNKEEKSEDRTTLSPSYSVRSFVIISGPGGEEEDKKSETEENGKFLKSVDNEFLDPSGEGRKNTKEDDVEKKNIEERKEEENDKKILVNLESFDNNETVNSSQSYVIGHVSYLKNENEGLRQQLNLAFNEITKLQTKVDQLSFNLNKKENVIKNLLRVFVNCEDTDSVCEENKI
ncbi:putative leucine-rich repeat-containing protein DDB_G0290503 [Leptopilina heterotoma]|uniref:putative leucine-rich repeat-containing protein DDB_G0290503 n=1 Tax=Leptopilina heterotoma TaxID=63436 RepID=UPI001CA7EEAB|nr:putative leucine-rich repeat-containing protein DDB_G0290503 [Leptopilina heterotoma]